MENSEDGFEETEFLINSDSSNPEDSTFLERRGDVYYETDIEDENPHRRLIDEDGDVDIIQLGLNKYKAYATDLFHTIVNLKWSILLLIVVTMYLTSYAIFGFFYYIGRDCLTVKELRESWLECFFFSVQTQATIGYGTFSPGSCVYANLVVAIQVISGIIEDAVSIGLIYTKFSRPIQRSHTILFSKVATIGMYNDIPCLMLRLINIRRSQLVESKVKLLLAKNVAREIGMEDYQVLDLDIDEYETPSSFLALPCLVVHKIDENSPLFGETKSSLKKKDAEVIAILEAMDPTSSGSFQSRYSYIPDEIKL